MTESGGGWRLGGRYLVLDRLGAGGMAEVFRARDETLGRDVAIKVFRSDVSPHDTATRAERRQMELDALARLNHPNLITLYDAELAGQPAYLVMELVEGVSLADRLRDGALAETATRELGRQVAQALTYVHARGMVHRDVKPANILLGRDGRARLSDFGIVRLLDQESLTNADSTLGTASYLAPEQMHGSQVGPPADVYALGLTLIEALTGTRSFDGPPLEAAMARLARDPVIPAHVAGPWPRLLAAMTAREPSARPSAEQVALALNSSAGAPAGLPADAPAGAGTAPLGAVLAGSTTAIPRSTPLPVTPPGPVEPERRIPGAVIAAAAVVAVLLVAGIVALIISSVGGDSPSGGTSTSPATTPSRSASSASTGSQSSPSPSTSVSTAPSTGASQSEPSAAPTNPSVSVPSSPSVGSSAPASQSVPATSGASPSGAASGNAQQPAATLSASP